ncbi:MAG: hypothetical protein ACM3MK_14560 [Chitinophagales bacterium]
MLIIIKGIVLLICLFMFWMVAKGPGTRGVEAGAIITLDVSQSGPCPEHAIKRFMKDLPEGAYLILLDDYSDYNRSMTIERLLVNNPGISLCNTTINLTN